MATYFGEVQELVSRAVEIDDSEEQPVYNFTTETTEMYTNDQSCNSLILCVGEIAKAFSKCYLTSDSSYKHILDVSYLPQHNGTDTLLYGGNLKIEKSKIAASVYIQNSDLAVCEIPSNLPETIHVELVDLILQHIHCANAFVLTCAPVVSFKGNLSAYSQTPLLMYLSTSQFIPPANMTIPRLQSPNYVSGIAAAILTVFEITKKPAACIVNFIESDILDFANVQAFEKLSIIDTFEREINDNNRTALVDYIKKHCNISNLYI